MGPHNTTTPIQCVVLGTPLIAVCLTVEKVSVDSDIQVTEDGSSLTEIGESALCACAEINDEQYSKICTSSVLEWDARYRGAICMYIGAKNARCTPVCIWKKC